MSLKWSQDNFKNKDIWTSEEKEILVPYILLLFMFDLIYFYIIFLSTQYLSLFGVVAI